MVEKNKKTILIFGSNGMLGQALQSSLNKKYNLVPLAHQDCDIRDAKTVTKWLKQFKPWLVIHSAAYCDVDGCQLDRIKAYEVNAKGTHNIASACRGLGAILIYISTDYVFDGKKKKAYRERDKTHPLNIYGKSKLRGEKIIKRLLNKYIIIRTCWLFGEARRNFAVDILERAKAVKSLNVVSDKFATPTYVKDLSEAILNIVNLCASNKWLKRNYGTYHINNSGFCSWYDYAKAVLDFAKITDVQVSPISIRQINFKARRPEFSVLDNSKFKKLINKPLRPWQDALGEYIRCKISGKS